MERIVLGHSGAADTAHAIAWLSATYGAQVATLTLDVGQGGNLEDVHERALASGAVRAHVIDVRDEFARDVVLPALRAHTPLDIRALTRAIVARHLVAMARVEEAGVVAYGGRHGTGDHPMTTLLESLDPSIARIALPRAAGADASIEASLIGRSIELHDPAAAPHADDLFVRTKLPSEAPDVAAFVELMFEAGVPVAINGVEMSPVELIQSLETIAGAHGVGRLPAVASRNGARIVQEAPAAMALGAAYAALGNRADGSVHLKFHQGDCTIVDQARRAPTTAVAR